MTFDCRVMATPILKITELQYERNNVLNQYPFSKTKWKTKLKALCNLWVEAMEWSLGVEGFRLLLGACDRLRYSIVTFPSPSI